MSELLCTLGQDLDIAYRDKYTSEILLRLLFPSKSHCHDCHGRRRSIARTIS